MSLRSFPVIPFAAGDRGRGPNPVSARHIFSAPTDRLLRQQFRVDSDSLGDTATGNLDVLARQHVAISRTENDSPTASSVPPQHRGILQRLVLQREWIVLTEERGHRGMQWTQVADDSQPAPGGGAVSEAQMDARCGVTATRLRRLRGYGWSHDTISETSGSAPRPAPSGA